MNDIEAFRLRIADDRDFCEELYRYATIRVLGSKYVYYQLGYMIRDDNGYDIIERDWYIMGRAFGYLEEDDTSPCIGFDESHPLAKEAIAWALTIPTKKG